uniref:Uncharacterized protein n=1 Tax=Anguilla anguilla TaxID=7936 RepID=A0A0E9UNV5_ANGAN
MDSPSQPTLSSYPKRPFGQTVRSFSAGWYQSRPWLEYSVSLHYITGIWQMLLSRATYNKVYNHNQEQVC